MEDKYSSETTVDFYVTTPHLIPEDSNIHVLILFC